jgi:hypothetical protein
MQSEGNTKTNKIEVAIVMDATASMQNWIDAACKTVLDAFSTLQNENPNSLFRLACVCYRDFGDEIPFIIEPFTEDISVVQNTIKNTIASGGSDQAEDIAGALEKVLQLEWSKDTCKLILWVCDAPAHGNKYHLITVDDRYPKGDPKGLEPSEQIKELSLKGIDFTMFRINKSIDKMVEIFSSIYNVNENVVFTLLDVIKQEDINYSYYHSDHTDHTDYINSSILSGFIDLSTYDDDFKYSSDYKKFKEEKSSSVSPVSIREKSFYSATIESVRKTIEKSNNKK